jgi:hypothetical protein
LRRRLRASPLSFARFACLICEPMMAVHPLGCRVRWSLGISTKLLRCSIFKHSTEVGANMTVMRPILQNNKPMRNWVSFAAVL